jgi:zinc transport system ATP-binding protein
MEPVVVFDNVCFSYTNREVLHEVSFSVEPNSFLGIVGPNGGGKTTLLRLMLGLERPDRGVVRVFGGRPERARGRAGYVMQHMAYDVRFPATVQDIVLMGLSGGRSWGPYTAADRRAAAESLDSVGMPGYGGRPFASLSGGQIQRVRIAQALVSRPELLLLDEPTAAVDSEGEEAIHGLLNALASSLTVVFVSHNINMVLRCVSHVLCVNKTVAMNRLDRMHPETLARACGGDLAVLHHELSCRIFERARKDTCEREVEEDTGRREDP